MVLMDNNMDRGQACRRFKIILALNFSGLLVSLILLLLLTFLLMTVMHCDQDIEIASKSASGKIIVADNTTKDDITNFKLRIIERKDWMAKPSKSSLIDLKLPINRIVVAHTDTIECFIESDCAQTVRFIQDQHMRGRKWDDIAWNYLIGGDGNVFMGRGWNKQGIHTKGYNTGTIAIAFIGSFSQSTPMPVQFYALKALLELGIGLEIIYETYLMYPQRAFSNSIDSPGDNVIDVIKEWSHYKDV